MDNGTPNKMAETATLEGIHDAYRHCATAITEQLGNTDLEKPEIIFE